MSIFSSFKGRFPLPPREARGTCFEPEESRAGVLALDRPSPDTVESCSLHPPNCVSCPCGRKDTYFFFHAKYGSPSHSSAPPHRRAASFVIDCHFLICLSRVSTLIFLMQSYLLFDGDLHSREGDPFKVCKKKGTLGCKTGKRHKGLETAPQKGQPQPCG